MLAQECLQKRIRSFGHEICRGLLTIFIHLPAQRNLPTFLCVSHLTLETTSVLGVSPLSSLKIEALVGLLSLTIVPFHRVQSGVGICILRWGVGGGCRKSVVPQLLGRPFGSRHPEIHGSWEDNTGDVVALRKPT